MEKSADPLQPNNALQNPFRWIAIGLLYWASLNHASGLFEELLNYGLGLSGIPLSLAYWIYHLVSLGMVTGFIFIFINTAEQNFRRNPNALSSMFKGMLILFICLYAGRFLYNEYLYPKLTENIHYYYVTWDYGGQSDYHEMINDFMNQFTYIFPAGLSLILFYLRGIRKYA